TRRSRFWPATGTKTVRRRRRAETELRLPQRIGDSLLPSGTSRADGATPVEAAGRSPSLDGARARAASGRTHRTALAPGLALLCRISAPLNRRLHPFSRLRRVLPRPLRFNPH